MATRRILAWIAVAAPLVAAAQTLYYRPAPVNVERIEYLRVCAERNDGLWDRKALIDQDRRLLDRENEAIARMRAEIDQAWSAADRNNAEVVAAHNSRTHELNRWVESHNKRVDELNGAVALLNDTSRALVDYCENITPAR